MIAVAIPFVDKHEITERCLEVLAQNARGDIELILIDNGSKERLTKIPAVYTSHYIRNDENLGVLNSLKQALKVVNSDIMLHMHNDVLIWEEGWDLRIQSIFDRYPNVGLAGFFGAPEVIPNGARVNPVSNMIGKEWGTPGVLHGGVLHGEAPSVIFDSLAMVWRVSSLKEVGISEAMPPHHWFDRILTLNMINAGYDCMTIGIAFDHWGSATYGKNEEFNKFVYKWCEDNNVDPGEDADLAMYYYGLRLFEEKYVHTHKLPLYVFISSQGTWVYKQGPWGGINDEPAITIRPNNLTV